MFFGLIVLGALGGMVLQFKLYNKQKRERDEEYYVNTLI